MRAILGGIAFSFFISVTGLSFAQNSSSASESMTMYSLPSDFPMTRTERLKQEEEERKTEALREQFLRDAREQALATAERAFLKFREDLSQVACLRDGNSVGLSWDESIKNLYTEDPQLVEEFFDYIHKTLPGALESAQSEGKLNIREVRLSRRGWFGNLANSLADGSVLELQIDSDDDMDKYLMGDRTLAEIIAEAAQRRYSEELPKQQRVESKFLQ